MPGDEAKDSLVRDYWHYIESHELAETLLNGDHLSAILRASIHFDNDLTQMILKRLPEAVHFMSERTAFSLKILYALRLGIIDEATGNALKTFNKLRNEFAHLLEKRQITSQDDAVMVKALPPAARDIISGLDPGVAYEAVMATSAKGDPTRIALIALHVHLINILKAI